MKVNLPQTEFPMKANLPKREPEILKFWEENKVYERLLEKNKSTGKVFVLHDGPPYSNGPIHLGHSLNKILKDIFVKYYSLKGYYSPFVPGWDNHGMPIENEVIKQFKEFEEVRKDPSLLKNDNLKLKIRERCREFANYWLDFQRREFIRLGVFGLWDTPYLTMDKDYEARELEILAELVEKGYIERSVMPVHWCPNCQTALAMNEVEYYDKESFSLWFMTKILESPYEELKDAYLIAWTTTPWTIIANRAFAFHPNYDYTLYEDKNGKKYLMAEILMPVISDIADLGELRKLKRFIGKDLEFIKIQHPLFEEKVSLGINADFVTLREGSGIVHIAPGHGKEDFEVGLKYGLEVFSPVDEKGNFTKEAGELFEGLFVQREGSLKAIEVLKARGLYLQLDSITHSYPYCWRCKEPLIFRATPQWFLRVDHNNLREKALKEILEVTWHPPSSINRIYNSVKERPDWVISRQRAWGVHIPAIVCSNCGYRFLNKGLILRVASMIRDFHPDVWLTLPLDEIIDDMNLECPNCKGREFQKEKDILDVWFDSGITNIVVHEIWNLPHPFDMFLEGTDQHRGWFNASLILSCALKGRSPYKVVLTHGFTLDEEGRAMHKSLGNVIEPREVTEKYGADVLRLWVASSDYTEDVKLGGEILKRISESYRKIRNTYRFMLGNLYDFDPQKDYQPYENLFPIDKFMLHRFNKLLLELDQGYQSYEVHRVFHKYFNFVSVDLSSFYLDVLKDRLYTWYHNSKGRRSAQTVIYEILKGLLINFSPILSFTCEEAWQFFSKGEDSVFLQNWVEPNPKWENPEIEKDFEILLGVRDVALREIEVARQFERLIQDRLEAELIITSPPNVKKVMEKYEKHLTEFFIVSGVQLLDGGDISVKVKRKIGKKCERCWMWHEEVGLNNDFPNLCPKCILAMGGKEP